MVSCAAVVVSWLGHVLAVFGVALIGRQLLLARADGATILSPAFWLPVLGVATDPLLMFVSRRIWIDSVLTGLTTLSLATGLLAQGPRRRVTLALAGILLGLAALAKLTALILLPVLLFACLREEESGKARTRSIAIVLTPVLLLVVPWLAAFYLSNGVIVRRG